MNVFLIALGANLPLGEQSPMETLRCAVSDLSKHGLNVESVSRLYKTPCFPPGSGPDYVNAAARVTGNLSARAALDALHTIEAEYGRERQKRWGMRTLDLDLLAMNDSVLPDQATFEAWQSLGLDKQKTEQPDHLIVPHPRIQDRAFVLVPLMDVAADWRHPVLLRTVKEMHDALSSEARAEIVVL